VLITGATSGIGREAVLSFVRAGARVLALGRDEDRLRALREACATPDRVAIHACDLLDGASMERVAQSVLAGGGAPDVVVANAGIGLDARFEHTSDDDVRAVFDTNVLGVYRTVRPYLPAMIERGSGRVLLISSVVGKRGIPNYSAYSGSKFALHGIAGALRAELHGTGVRVGLVCPSSTTTGFHERVRRSGPAQRRVRLASHTAESVAGAIVAMARSDRREIVLSAEGKAMAWTEKFLPGLLDVLLGRVLVDRREKERG
jgi:short-subunit dehydrogenase